MTSETCRLCGLQKPNMQPIFIETSKGLPVNELRSYLPQLISKYLYLNVARNDDLPKKICADCYRHIKRWKNFAKICKKTQNNLRILPFSCDALSTSSQRQESENGVPPILPESAEKETECVIITIEDDVNSLPTVNDVLKPVETIEAEPVVYSCNYCDKTYTNKRTHSRHVSIMHENPQEYHCAHCSKSFYLKPALKCHLETHAPGRDFCCHVCGATFRTGSALRGHLQLHRADYAALECAQCGKRFKLPHQLERHRRTHSDLRPYQCAECPLNFVLRNHLTRHVEAVHNQVTKRACPTCGKTYRYLNHYRAHMLRHAGQRDNKCDACDKCFVTRNDLMRHARIHTREKPFKCTLCTKTFADCSNRKRHILSHEGRSRPRARSKAVPPAPTPPPPPPPPDEAKTYASLESFYAADSFDHMSYDAALADVDGPDMFMSQREFDGIDMPVFLEVGGDAGSLKDAAEMFLCDDAGAGFVIGNEILIDGSLMGP